MKKHVACRIAAIWLILRMLCIGVLPCEAAPATTPYGADVEAVYDSLSHIDSERLLSDSRRWVEADTLTELAITALNIVANRYYDSPVDTSMRSQVIEAHCILGNLYMVRAIDYKKAYRSLSMARQIAEENADYHSLASIYSSLANLYSVNPGDRERKSQKVEECLALATEAAIRSGNTDLLRTITASMSVWSFPRRSWGNLEKSICQVKERYSRDPSFAGPLALAAACDSYFCGDMDAAESHLLEAREKLDFRKFSERYRYSVDLILSDLYAETGKYTEALSLMREDMEMAERDGHSDFLLNIYDQMTRLFRESGVSDSTDYYYLKYSKLKNDLAERSGLGKVEELDFLSQIDKINAEIERLSFKRRQDERRNIIVLAALIVTIVLLFALLWIYVNLKRNHRSLFERNREMLLREEEHKMLRRQWEEERRRNSNQATDDSDAQTDSIQNEDNLESLRKTYANILMIFEESPEIYGLGFSITDLAAIVGKPVKVVSKAINVCHGGNFHQLLNKYRLREAARLMHDPDNRSLTIEGIAERAGFKSRTSFASLFKKSMGLTPSEYWHMARQDGTGLPDLPDDQRSSDL